jgi:hypothetical protein
MVSPTIESYNVWMLYRAHHLKTTYSDGHLFGFDGIVLFSHGRARAPSYEIWILIFLFLGFMGNNGRGTACRARYLDKGRINIR